MPSALTFGTYNLHGMSEPRCLRSDLEVLSFVNTWAFQEVGTTGEDESSLVTPELLQTFRDILPAGEWYGVYVPVNRCGRTWEGQAVVSRWPIQSFEVWELESTGRKHRVALAARLGTPHGPVTFVNTDHETAFLGIGPKDRAKQVRSLVRNLENDRSSMAIVTGDFNTSGMWLGIGATREIATLSDCMSEAGFVSMGAGSAEITFHAWPVYLCLDHMFLRNMASVAWGVYRGKGSDHYPLWCHAMDVR